jgi:DNA-binding MarR family transcriptional regulator
MPDDTELARLLTELVRVLSPGDAATGAAQPSGSEARALIELVKAHGIAQGELATLLGLEKSTVSRLAASLERKGWIRRGRDEGNQRYVRLHLTAEGGAVADRLWIAWNSRQARILAALSEDERAGLSRGLAGLVRGLAAEGLLGADGTSRLGADGNGLAARDDGEPDAYDAGRYTEAPSAR